MNPGGRRLREAAYWITPSLICLLVHWYGFNSWFRTDDFAWLGLADRVYNFHDLLMALFHPEAQGTIRPWSERAFFMAEYTLFGLSVLPYRLVIFATQFADLVLVAAIGARLTGLRAAGFWAAILWAVNSATVQPLAWVSSYNEVLCALFLLLAFYFLLRWVETGRSRYNVLQWATFLLGFGALELNMVYPAVAAGYTFFCARKYFRRTLPLFAVSAAYFALHTWAAPPARSGVYAMHFDGSMLRTFTAYWAWAVSASYLVSPLHLRHWMMMAGVAILTLALAWFVWRQARGGYGAVWVCLIWYLATVGPLLPLRDHWTEYYVYLPFIGLAWLGGWALAKYPGIPAFSLAGLYVFLALPQTLEATHWNYALSHRVEDLVEGLAGAHRLHPEQKIMLTGVDAELFYHAVRDKPNLLLGIDHIYLAPGTEKQIASDPAGGEDAAQYVLPGYTIERALARNQLVVYDVRGARLRNITTAYAARPQSNALPLYLNAGDPLTSDLLGPEWYAREEDHRWMPKRATFKLGAPQKSGQSLYLHGYVTEEQLRGGALTVTVTVDGASLPALVIPHNDFTVAAPLPDSVVGKPEMHVSVEVSRTIHPITDTRELGLAFGTFEVR